MYSNAGAQCLQQNNEIFQQKCMMMHRWDYCESSTKSVVCLATFKETAVVTLTSCTVPRSLFDWSTTLQCRTLLASLACRGPLAPASQQNGMFWAFTLSLDVVCLVLACHTVCADCTRLVSGSRPASRSHGQAAAGKAFGVTTDVFVS